MVEKANIVSCKLVVPCCYPPEVFDLAKEALDQVSLFVDGVIEASPSGCCGAARHDGFGPVAAMASTRLVVRSDHSNDNMLTLVLAGVPAKLQSGTIYSLGSRRATTED